MAAGYFIHKEKRCFTLTRCYIVVNFENSPFLFNITECILKITVKITSLSELYIIFILIVIFFLFLKPFESKFNLFFFCQAFFNL